MTVMSMTGFGQALMEGPARVVAVEIRSVNHRYAETVVRVPREYAALEERCRTLLQPRVIRGRVEVSISIVERNRQTEVSIDYGLLQRLQEAEQAVTLQVQSPRATAYEWLTYPGVVTVFSTPTNMDEVWEDVEPVVTEAAAHWQAAGTREGMRLETDLRTKLRRVQALVDDLTQRIPQVLTAAESNLWERIGNLAKEVDEARLWTEIAVLLDKLSIDEELLRLNSHLVEFTSSLGGEGALGRRLDFLIQEMNREVNTIGSKSADGEISRVVVDMKTIIEQMREQVQNIA
jgi:uncharacterized protein (TIGR00255 family)